MGLVENPDSKTSCSAWSSPIRSADSGVSSSNLSAVSFTCSGSIPRPSSEMVSSARLASWSFKETLILPRAGLPRLVRLCAFSMP